MRTFLLAALTALTNTLSVERVVRGGGATVKPIHFFDGCGG